MHVISTAGHVGQGKTTLAAALAGMDPIRFPGEKARGMSVDVGFAWCRLPSGREINVVDVPGQDRFIAQLLTGITGVNAVLFVVAADEGWTAQSSEHLAIMNFVGISRAVVVITKCDVTAERPELKSHLANTMLSQAPVVEVSAKTFRGIDALKSTLDTLLSVTPEAPDRGRPRFFIDRSLGATDAGTVVTGTLLGGTLAIGDVVQLQPNTASARIRSLQTHRAPTKVASPGDRLAVTLSGLERASINRGDAVVTPGQWTSSDSFAVRLRAAPALPYAVAENGAYELHIGSVEVPCRLKFLEDGELTGGGTILSHVFCMRAVPMQPGDRFVIRDTARWATIAGGVVLEHFQGRRPRGDPELIERLLTREAVAREEVLEQVVSDRRSVRLDELGELAGLASRELRVAVQAAPVVITKTYALDRGYARALRAEALQSLADFHVQHPLDLGMPREHLVALIGADSALLAELVDGWISEGAIRAESASLRLPSHGAALPPEQARQADAALAMLRAGKASPPPLSELGLTAEVIRALVGRGDVVVVAPDIGYATDSLHAVERAVADLINRRGRATVAEVRDTISTSRKYAVPLLEYFDQTHLTMRKGDHRVLGPRGHEILGL